MQISFQMAKFANQAFSDFQKVQNVLNSKILRF